MSGLFHSLLGKKHAEPECVTTAGITARLEHMFSKAEDFIILISPYITLSLRLRDILSEKKKAGVDIIIVHKGDFAATDIPTRHFQRSNLHATCFLTEKAALVGSMNLYDYSQVNNDELGIYLEKKDFPGTYETIHAEAQRLCRDFTPPLPAARTRPARSSRKQASLERGKYYSPEKMKKFFAFEDDHPGGIRPTKNGNIVLCSWSRSRYNNREEDGILYYQGQNTGTETQLLIYGNKSLYDCFENPEARIFFFRDGVFAGEKYICRRPFQEQGKWIFPLKDKGPAA